MSYSICVDAASVRYRLTGVGHYALEVARALARLPVADQTIDVFDGLRIFNLRSFLKRANARQEGRKPYIGDTLERFLGERVRFLLDRQAGRVSGVYYRRRGKANYHVVHAMNFFAPLPLGEVVLPVMHDLSVLKHPEYHPADRVRWFNQNLASMGDVPLVLTVSEFSRREIATLIGAPEARIRVAYPGVDARFFEDDAEEDARVLSRFGLTSRRYALSVSTLEPRKNLRTLVEAYARLPARVRAAMPLVLVGANGWGDVGLPPETERLRQAGEIRVTGYVDDAALRALYRGAAGFFYPSLYEGYGMPVTEALACGAAVVISRGVATEEAALGLGLTVDPLDVESWSRTFEIVADEASREAEGARAARRAAAATRTWAETAAISRQAYRDAWTLR